MDPSRGQSRKRQRSEHPSETPNVNEATGATQSQQTADKDDSKVLYSQEQSVSADFQQDLRQFKPPMTTQIDWRETLCQFLGVSPGTDDNALVENLQNTTQKAQTAEAAPSTSSSPTPELEIPRYQVIHRILCLSTHISGKFPEAPWVVKGGAYGAHLMANSEIENFELYLERNKNLHFLVYKDYSCCDRRLSSRELRGSNSAKLKLLSTGEAVYIISEEFSRALKQLAEDCLHKEQCPEIEVCDEVQSPYIWWYRGRSGIETALLKLDPTTQAQIRAFKTYVEDSLGPEYEKVDALIAQGKIAVKYLAYIYAPGQIVISTTDGIDPQNYIGYHTQSWLGSKTHSRSIEVSSWTFDGKFQLNESTLKIGKIPSESKPFKIRSLEIYPIEFASEETEYLLRTRGEMFWACRKRKYVCCNREVDVPINAANDPRFMIDIEIFNQFHPSEASTSSNRDDLGEFLMAEESPPFGDDFLLCLPTHIPGYHMQKKQWITLPVSRIRSVEWNTKAFETLVVSHRTKELITALVTNQIAVERGTDLMSGKGNGLFILLHGGPGTGKTLTAESVAEIAEKPLYRVTCGDIGTNAEEVEKYLETVLLLGKIWGCVVLLDEADIFLEERTLNDYKRNALVSVFLRVLEYYDGILILTSNRVATFDEAFKSRIQLSLRYKALGPDERLKIWQNFIDHISNLPEQTSSTQSLTDSGRVKFDYGINAPQITRRLPEFAGAVLNGREIRNVVTTARQLAMYRKQPLSCEHITSVMEEAKKFDEYLKEVQGGMNSDELKREEQVR